eukprot:CAMPEP_0172457270 /NCGR_PEP_ID=MMETSP1065-20121228/21189_1 /TAXON_ID=265537 /ORGANISM="Amphiprora paludosa, Strain CCMP125" /LENGTH=237 /DNA_ID=CAMNT_0013210895 /DNA_START=65 /DNA_END=778 /DNA_ORIENTATION=-
MAPGIKSVLSGSTRPCRSSLASFSSYSNQQQPPPLMAYPSYSIYGENGLLGMKLLSPRFKISSTNVMTLPPKERGRIMFEWIPKDANGRLNVDKTAAMRFALSAEEIGLLLDQLPENGVSFYRKSRQFDSEYMLDVEPGQPGTQTDPDKVCHVTPGEAGLVTFLCDFELNGEGGQLPPPGEASAQGPMQITAQAGEFQVMREILRSSIPQLVGWQQMTQIAMQRAFDRSLAESTGQY